MIEKSLSLHPLATAARAISLLQAQYECLALGVSKPLVQAVSAEVELARRATKDARDPEVSLLCRKLGALIQRRDLKFIHAHRRGITNRELVDIAGGLEQAFQEAQCSLIGTPRVRIVRRGGTK